MDARRMLTYIDASPSPFHACADRPRARSRPPASPPLPRPTRGPPRPAGTSCGAAGAWSPGQTARGTTRPPPGSGSIGAHTDSPNLRIKPHPDAGRAGYRQLAVEVYGGALLNSWLDRDLGLSGRVVVRGADGPEERLLLVDRPLCRVPQLAIHLDREITANGLLLNAQQHLSPIWGLGDATPGGVRRLRRRASSTSTPAPSSAGT